MERYLRIAFYIVWNLVGIGVLASVILFALVLSEVSQLIATVNAFIESGALTRILESLPLR